MPASTPLRPERRLYQRTGVRITAGLAIAFSALLLLLIAGRWVADGAAQQFDALVREHIHRSASPRATGAMQLVTALGSTLVWVPATAALAALFAGKGWPRAAGLLLATMAGSALLNFSLKMLYRRARPAPFFGLEAPGTYSFPSGHALDSLCFYGILAAILSNRVSTPSLRILLWCSALGLAGTIGYSRIYLGVHYPSDVLAGYAAAGLWISAVTSADRYLQARLRPERAQPR